MKKLLLLAGITSVLLTGCRNYPNADFAVDFTTVQPGENVRFTNFSDNAIRYEWNFGDGYFSTDPNPVHSYDQEGTYTVILTAVSGKGKVDRSSIIINVIYTLLEITVAEWNQNEIVQFVVPNAYVVLYETYNDWYYDLNPVVDGYTNHQGIVTFAGLDPIRYYVYTEAANTYEIGDWYDNWEMPDSYIRTAPLVAFALNEFLCWADYFPGNKSFIRNRRAKSDKDKIKDNESSFIIVDVSK